MDYILVLLFGVVGFYLYFYYYLFRLDPIIFTQRGTYYNQSLQRYIGNEARHVREIYKDDEDDS